MWWIMWFLRKASSFQGSFSFASLVADKKRDPENQVARKTCFIDRGQTLESKGMNKRDEI